MDIYYLQILNFQVTEALKLVDAAIVERDDALEREKLAIGKLFKFVSSVYFTVFMFFFCRRKKSIFKSNNSSFE